MATRKWVQKKKKLPSLLDYIRGEQRNNLLKHLEEKNPGGFILKTEQGQYEYTPQSEIRQKTFRPKVKKPKSQLI